MNLSAKWHKDQCSCMMTNRVVLSYEIYFITAACLVPLLRSTSRNYTKRIFHRKLTSGPRLIAIQCFGKITDEKVDEASAKTQSIVLLPSISVQWHTTDV